MEVLPVGGVVTGRALEWPRRTMGHPENLQIFEGYLDRFTLKQEKLRLGPYRFRRSIN